MATAAETEASSTDGSWGSGSGGDDGMKPVLPEPESSPQDGGGGFFAAAEVGGGGAGPEETARSHCHEQPQHASEAAAAAVPKGAEEPERPVRRSFQIPRKSREKKGVYLCRYADLLQANPLEVGAVGDVVIFKIMKGKIKSIYDPLSVKSLEPVLNKNALDPTPKHECHVSKNASRITSLLAYRAYELTQYYFYEYGFDELKQRPRHVCPYAVVSFTYKDDKQTAKFMSSLSEILTGYVVYACTTSTWDIEVSHGCPVSLELSLLQHQTAQSRILHALFLFQEPRCLIITQKGVMNPAPQEKHENISDILKITQFLQFALIQCRKEFQDINTINFYSVVEKYVSEFFKRGFGSGKREFFMFSYDSRLDDKKFLYSAPRNKYHIDDCLHTYIYQPEMYQLPIFKLKELFEENRKRQQFSPLSDYEGQDEEINGSKMKFGKRNGSRGETTDPAQQKSSHSLDYDKDRVKELINLIQCTKKNVGGDPDTEDTRSKNILKRKLEDLPENMRKFAKTSNSSDNYHLYEESPQSIGLLGHDPNLRLQQEEACNIGDAHKLYNWLSEALANERHSDARHSDAFLTDTVNKALGLSSNSGACEELRQKCDYELNPPLDKKDCEQPACTKVENVHFKGAQSPLLEVDAASVKYPTLASSTSEDPNLINVSNFEECSLCPTVSIEHGFLRQHSKSHDEEETEIHWKLIPITGLKSPGEPLVCLPPLEAFPHDPRVISRERSADYQFPPSPFTDTVKGTTEEDLVSGQVVTVEEQCVPAAEPPAEYLTKLGNTECHPDQFLERRSTLDKLLIIIQNEDIADFIHKVPGLVTLKKLPCVSFAGVDSLDDVKNHTYNELFVSGGFIVSDESILNPEVVTIESLKIFLTFLEELSTPEGKWQWKIHCKFQKKLKELGRLNTKALSLLSLLNVYQKKHLVEILSYHNCDSQTRNAPEMDCLIRLQAQNIQQRHIVFLTEKTVNMVSSYTDNGIVVATAEDFMQNFKSLVGYHSSVTEENLPLLGANDNLESQSALLENGEKDEEDMSLDSGDEISHIEVFSSFHSEILARETKGSSGTDQKNNNQIELQSSLDVQNSLLEDKTSHIDCEERAPIDRVCSEGENSNSAEQDSYSNVQAYQSQLEMSRQFSHFNVLTHQTFLGTPYALASTQSQENENYFLSAYKNLYREKSSLS
ncbi:Protein TASOR [Microtus ochrogaster]|uniref:Protein TASOR n=1 Tax=Microtus ochrogaster TaxID=79684 RepID=A0A8J6GPI0_MICOH|nr:Protein TASOR [Microtus ochrogaster]